MKKIVKKIVFVVIVLALILGIGLLVKTGKFAKLEGYMYSFAADITGISTDSDATSSEATSSNATSCDATSSNATSSNATSCNATSSNAIKVTNNTEGVNTISTNKITKVEAITVEEETERDFEYKNSEITKEVIDKIKASDENRNVVITVDVNKNISKEIFDAIKGTSRQLTIKSEDNQIIFNGKDIKNSKDIDATISHNLVKNDDVLNVIGQNGIVVNFADNGELPGIATVRIKVTDDIKTAISFNTIYVYYYNEANKELIKMDNNAKYKNGFIEFAINHNSKYVFVNEEIPENDGTTVADDNVTFLESHKMYIIIIIIAVFTVAFVIVILIVDKKTKGKVYKQKQ